MLDDCLQYLAQNKLEVLAVVLSIAGVWLTAKEKIINWPINIVASILSVYLFYLTALYGDAILNGFFVIMCVYGWYEWLHGGKENSELSVSISSPRVLGVLLLLTIAGSLLFGKMLNYTNSTVPYWDGITTALSLAATWMATKKLIENWLVWIFTDMLYVAMYYIKHLYAYSILYFIFTLLAVYGYYAWKKQIKPLYA
ncbi:MAG TPA: nicotinamide riboside transporter PnuC [Bacteroidia bacterium]|jgi:nicotinamide mononucleotide transporter|nr:nicotinamide riboside transporter PnuC [Bacteroidia bacterium]